MFQSESAEQIKKIVLEKNGFKGFNPMQKLALQKDWQNSSIVVSAPTASGKTIIAELCALNCILNRHKKVIYTSPLKALASEHYKDWKRKYSDLGIRIAISTGDFDSSSHYLSNYDLIFTTNEKLDSLITHRAGWLSNTGLLIVDEIHELSGSRGATLEAVVVKMRYILPKLQVLALSATIPNANEIAEWLGAELVVSDYRPVKLMEGIFFNNAVDFKSYIVEFDNSDYVEAIVRDTIAKKKQALFFMNTRKNAENLARKVAPIVSKNIFPKEKLSLQKLSEKVLNVLEQPTEQCKKLASLIEKGVAFHHAGLLAKQRELIEEAFREGKLKVLTATPTLAAGVNLPAFRVVIPSLYRYAEYGMQRIPVSSYKQMAGRAGRPKYDSAGEAIIVARSAPEKEELWKSYIEAMPEDVNSALAYWPVLRMQTLAAIAGHFIFDYASLEEFFSKTFYCKQYGKLSSLVERIHEIIDELMDYGFIEERNDKLFATQIGKRVAELYLDPASANTMIKCLERELSELGCLYCVVDTTEFSPWLSVSRSKEAELWNELLSRENELPIDVSKQQFFDEHLLEKFYSALMLEDWINEKSEQDIMEHYNVQPGILHSKLQICDWLAYAASELAKLIDAKENAIKMRRMRKRLKYGVKEELLRLVELRYIGRVRARRLYRAGLKNVTDIKKADVNDLARILGAKVAGKIKEQLKQKKQ